ncbi:MAG: methionine synthase [Actinobacteria bacterium]|nr:methionine synthase [Actinomycetota bacterium]
MHSFLETMHRRVVVLDGAMGTSLQDHELSVEDFGGRDGCNEVLVRTRPDVVAGVHARFLASGCDAVETDTFGGAPWVLDEYGLGDDCEELNRTAAEIAARACADVRAGRDAGPWVVGSIGPGTRSPTLSLAKDPHAADHITYDLAVDGYTRQARGLLAGGAEVLLVETCYDLLQAKAAIWACHQAMAAEGTTAPLLCSVTIEQGLGTMLLGSDIGAAITALTPLGIDVLGLNCATGPADMREPLRHLSRHSPLPILVIPNAGIPTMVDGRPHYALSPTELADAHADFVTDFGVQIVGGCCGTTPEHIATVVDRCGPLTARTRQPSTQASVASLYSAVALRQDTSFHIIGERLNANGSRKFRELLLAEDWDGIIQMAKEQARGGAHTLDVCVDYVGRDGADDMTQVVDRLATQSTLPLVLDSTEIDVVSTGLRRLGGRAVINSVNLEDGRRKADRLFPLARQFGAALVALAIDEQGQARTVDWKVDVCRQLADIAVDDYGLSTGDLIFDTLTFPLGSGQEELRADGMATLDAIERVKAEIPGCHTVLGVSNISFGLSPAARQTLNSVFLHEAVQRGLDAAIVHPGKILPLHTIDEDARRLCEDLIYDRRSGDYDPLHGLMAHFEGATEAVDGRPDLTELPLDERLQRRIVDGERDGLPADLDAAMAAGIAPLDIINTHLLAGMKTVGDLFGAGQMQLPFVLQSAETMKSAVRHLEPHLDRADSSGKARVVLATVKGDVHDIGKNLVDIILTNNGYDVRNLGIKQPIDAIIDAAAQFSADAIGLSGLLVKSTVVMRDDLDELSRRGLDRYPIMLGGAALTRAYVEDDLRQRYAGPLFYCRDAFAGLSVMDELVAHRDDGPPPDWGRGTPTRPSPTRRRPAPRPTGDSPGRSDVATDVPVPIPPFWGSRVHRGVALEEILPLLNTTALFRNQWGFARDDREVAEAALRQTIELARTEGLLAPQAVYGYFACNSDGDDLLIYEAPDSDTVVTRWSFPRQSGSRRLCIADFFRPVDSPEHDVIALQCVTVGDRVTERAAELFAEDRYTEYLYLHGLGVETAEALAEHWHARVRAELQIAGADAATPQELFRQGYQGSRYSFGYAACPDLEMRAPLLELLDAERIGVVLSESFQLHPEQSTDAFVVHHPQARYFNAR